MGAVARGNACFLESRSLLPGGAVAYSLEEQVPTFKGAGAYFLEEQVPPS